MNDPKPTSADAATSFIIGEVRYSLPQILKELEIERASGSFAMEKLDQKEITKMFKASTAARRAKSKK